MVQDIAYENYKLPAFLVNLGLSIVSSSIEEKLKVDLFDQLDPYTVASRCSAPALFIVGSEDGLVRPKRVNQLYKTYGTEASTGVPRGSNCFSHEQTRGVKKQFLEVRGNHTETRDESVITSCFQFLMRELRQYQVKKDILDKTVYDMNKYIRIKGIKPYANRPQKQLQFSARDQNKLNIPRGLPSSTNVIGQRKLSTPQRDLIRPIASELNNTKHKTNLKEASSRTNMTQREIQLGNKENNCSPAMVRPNTTLVDSNVVKVSEFSNVLHSINQPKFVGQNSCRPFPQSGAGQFNGHNTNLLKHNRTKSMANFPGFFDPRLLNKIGNDRDKSVNPTNTVHSNNFDNTKNISVNQIEDSPHEPTHQRKPQPLMVLVNNRTTPIRGTTVTMANSREVSTSRPQKISTYNNDSRKALEPNPLQHSFQNELLKVKEREKDSMSTQTPDPMTPTLTENSEMPSINRSEWKQFGFKSNLMSINLQNDSVLEEIRLLDTYLKGAGGS
jgi:hypothetical protein